MNIVDANTIAAVCLAIIGAKPLYRGFVEKPLTIKTAAWEKERKSSRLYGIIWLFLAVTILILGFVRQLL